MGRNQMIPFAIGTLVGAGCVVVWSELYTRWLYKDVKRRAKKQGISDEKMRAALMWATSAEIGKNLDGSTTKRG